jgi:predicted GH43/DUF377 family glycosyl hydrolase
VKWTKQGRIFCPDGNFDWMQTHAAGPLAEHLGDDRYRVYFGCRDAVNRTSIGFVELDITRPDRILRVSTEPVVGPGAAGLFDDSGASTGCLVRNGASRYLYYLGWNLGVTVPWRNTIGLAVAEGANGPFTKYSRAPLLDRSEADPFSISYPWVLHDEGRWRMWYGSNKSWGKEAETMAHVIKYAESDDGVHWRRDGRIAIDSTSPGEYAIAKPCVVRDGALYRMWYSHRGPAYRIGYAESADGLRWQRKDEEAGIEVSPGEWDGESIQYACVFRHRSRMYMLYNGNHYGKTGFGLAISNV